MSIREFLSGTGFLVAIMALAALAEVFVPLFASPRDSAIRRRSNLAMTALTFLVNWGLASGAALLPFVQSGPGLLAKAGLAPPLEFLLGVVLLDFAFGYAAHRLMHVSPLLWRVHRVHHSDRFVDVTTTYRTHPLESAWRYLCLMVPIVALGIPAPTVAAYRILSALNGILEHANIRLVSSVDALLTRFWVTPNMHKVHHSRIATQADTNYGNLLSLHDRLLGTFTASDRAATVEYGLDDAPGDAPLPVLLAMPFRRILPGDPERVGPVNGVASRESVRCRGWDDVAL